MNRLSLRLLSSLPARTAQRSIVASTFIRHSSSTPLPKESDLTHPALLKDPPISNPSSESDPWLLSKPPPPPAGEDASDLTMEELIASPHPEGRDSEPTENLRKRLVYESRKRGILEMELLLGIFAKTRLAGMSDRELREYDRVSSLCVLFHLASLFDQYPHFFDVILTPLYYPLLQFLTLPDWSIYYYVTDKALAPQPWKDSWILNELLDHAKNKGRSIRTMPDLVFPKADK